MGAVTGAPLPEIITVLTEEITRRAGQVIDVFISPSFVQARSVLPRFAEARPDDQLQAGVALRAARGDVRVHPYLFRLVCNNGQIHVEAAHSRKLVGLEKLETTEALDVIRQAIVACCADDAFTDAMARVRDAAAASQVSAIHVMGLMARIPVRAPRRVLDEIRDRFVRSGDRTRYGLSNAVTSVARDTRNWPLRWDLEEFGGAVLAGDVGVPPDRNLAAARMTSRAEAAVER